MADRSPVEKWEFKDKHLDPNITSADANKFISAARCILYGAPADKSVDQDGAPTIANYARLGVVQGYNWSENKQIEQVWEIGSDIPYYIPGRTMGQLSISRILLSGQDLLNTIYTSGANGEAVGPENWIKSLKDINIPMDLLFCFYGEGDTKGTYDVAYSRLFKNCWMQARSEGISAGQILVAENVSLLYEFVSDYNFKTGK